MQNPVVVIIETVWKNPSEIAADNETPDVIYSNEATRKENPITRIP